jgi:hypothetical protein
VVNNEFSVEYTLSLASGSQRERIFNRTVCQAPPPLKICYIYALERYTLQSAKDLFIGLIENLSGKEAALPPASSPQNRT